jgi:hypothetical protein
VAGRIGVDEAVVVVRLEVEPGRPGSHDPGVGRDEVVDEEVEVHLHGYVAVRPIGRAVVGDLLETDGSTRPGDRRPVLAALRHAAGDLRVEPRERDRVGRVDRRPAQPDPVGHQPTPSDS